eukprot:CAMPEP_0172927592 /NCGR_PEP_ID=MMETSP1075-20121228/217542_1 /TAXON_ID=2916 /ORGANISM="Ceratium fusus, Strain PA161109" /LENGTH=225 /DNA_ID=CAMNT_0013788851 /DNA_START=197 /DNA_END=871 /DNA_ORIENTATION=-
MTAIEVALAACCVVMSGRALRASNPAFAGRGRRMRGPASQSTIGRMAVLEKDSLGRYRFQVDEGNFGLSILLPVSASALAAFQRQTSFNGFILLHKRGAIAAGTSGGTRAGGIGSPIGAPAHITAASPDQLSAWSGTMTAIEVALAACCVVMSSRALRASNPAFAGRGRRMRGCCATTSSAAATLNSGSNLVGTCSPVSQSTIGRMAVLEKDSLGRYRFQVDEGG